MTFLGKKSGDINPGVAGMGFVMFCRFNTVAVLTCSGVFLSPFCLTYLCDGAEPCPAAACCSPAEAPAVQGLLPSMLWPRDCVWLSAFLNWGLEHSWLDAADEIPLKIIALRVTWVLHPHFGKCRSAYRWGSWILIWKGSYQSLHRLQVLQTCYLGRMQTSLCSVHISPLTYFQVAIIFKVHFCFT